VVWEETGCAFSATVIGEYEPEGGDNGAAHFDIYYDEEVGGKRVTERHVSITRLSKNASKRDTEEERHAEYENLSTCGGRYLHATSGKELLSKLISLKEDEDDDVDADEQEEEDAMLLALAAENTDSNARGLPAQGPDSMDSTNAEDADAPEMGVGEFPEVRQSSDGDRIAMPERPKVKLELSPQQVVMLNEALHVDQILALINGPRRTLRFITEQLITIVTQETQPAPSFEDMYLQWQSTVADEVNDVAQWLAPGQEGGKLLTHCRSILAAGAALMRILSCHTPGLDVAPVDEEHIESCVRWVAALVHANCGVVPLKVGIGENITGRKSKTASTSSRSKQDLSSSSAAKFASRANAKSSSTTAFSDIRKVLQEVGASLLPLVKASLDTLDVLLAARRQPDRLCIASYELSLGALRAEPASSPRAELVSSANAFPLQAMHAAAINVLQTMGGRYPSHRSAILSECILLLATTHSCKVIGRTFPVHFSVHATVKREKTAYSQSRFGSSSGSGNAFSSSTSASAQAAQTQAALSNDRYISTSFAALLLFIQSAAGAENAQSLLGESQRLCKTVVNDLLTRASHKEMGGEYRLITTSLLLQIETALSSPLLPVSAMLLDTLLAKVLSDLFVLAGEKEGKSSSSSGIGAATGAAASAQKDATTRGSEQSFINFLLDLVGNTGQVLRCVVLGGAKTSVATAGSTMSVKSEAQGQGNTSAASSNAAPQKAIVTLDAIDARVLRALKRKLHEKEEEWLLRKRRPEISRLPADTEADSEELMEEDKGEDDQEEEEEDEEEEMEIVDAEDEAEAEADADIVCQENPVEPHQGGRSSRSKTAAKRQAPIQKQAKSAGSGKTATPAVSSPISTSTRATRKRSSSAATSAKRVDPNDPFGGGSFSIEQTLRILGEVTSVTIDAIAEYEQVLCAHETEREGAGSVTKRHTDFGAEPINVLRQVGCTRILALMAPAVQAVDVSRHLICEYMHSIAMNTGSDGTAYSTILSLWYKDCTDTNRVEVAGYVEQCIRAVPILLQQHREYADRNAVAPAVVTGPYSEQITITKAARAAAAAAATEAAVATDNSATALAMTSSQDQILINTKPLWESRMSFEWVQRSYHTLLAEWFGLRQYESVVALLLNLLASEQSPLLRARAIKTLNVLFQTDASLISRSQVCRAVTRRLNDAAISVREETVKLIGNYVLQCSSSTASVAAGALGASGEPEKPSASASAADEYLDGLLLRLRDRGVSVRRAVVLLLRELLLRQLMHPRYSELCLALLERTALPKEEDSIKDTVRATFHEVWLTLPKYRELSLNDGQRSASSRRAAAAAAAAGAGAGITVKREETVDAFEMPMDGKSLNVATGTGHITVQSIALDTEDGVTQPVVELQTVTMPVQSARSEYIEHVAMQIIDVLSSSTQESTKSEVDAYSTLTSLIQDVLHGKSDGDEANNAVLKRREQSAAHCIELVKALMEILLKLEEEDSGLQRLYAHRRTREVQLVSTIATIAVFCSAHPPLLLPHMSALLPYLKPHSALNSQQHSDVTLNVCRMLAAVCVITDAPGAITHSVSFQELCIDLTNIALGGSYHNVDAAIKCLAALGAYVTGDVRPYMALASKCFTAVKQAAQAIPDRRLDQVTSKLMIAVSPQLCARVQRCLIVLGAVCEHSTLCAQELAELARRQGLKVITPSPTYLPPADEDEEESATAAPAPQLSLSRPSSHGSLHSLGSLAMLETPMSSHRDRCAVEEAAGRADIANSPALSPATLNGCVHAAAVFALTLPDEGCEVRAVQALCRVYIGCPKLITLSQHEGLLYRLLSPTNSSLLHEKLLGGLNHMMLAEEARLEGKQVLSDMRGAGVNVGEAVLSAASERDSDVSATAAAVLAHLRRITDFLYSDDSALRSEGLELIATLLRQGMLCPLDIIAHLVALQADPQDSLRQRALRLLQTQDDKYTSFVDNRLLDGFEAAYTLSIATTGQALAVRPIEIRGEDNIVREVLSTSAFAALFKTMIQPSKTRRAALVVGVLKRVNALMAAIRGCRQQLSHALYLQALARGSRRTDEMDSPTAINTSRPEGSRTSNAAIPVSPDQANAPDAATVLHRIAHLQGCVTYLTSTLAHLPYESAAEPLQIIQWITRNVPVDASILCASLNTSLVRAGATVQAKAKAPMTLQSMEAGNTASTASAASIDSTGQTKARMSVRAVQANLEAKLAEAEMDSFNHHLTLDATVFEKWYTACHLWHTEIILTDAATVSVEADAELLSSAFTGASESRCRESLLRLKSFLKTSYNLSSERCQAYIAHSNAQESRAVSEIIRTCDDANGGGRVKALSHAFIPASPAVAPSITGSVGGINSSMLMQFAALHYGPPTLDHVTACMQLCVADIARLSTLLISDDDFADPRKHEGGSSRKAASHKSQGNSSSSGSGGKRKRAKASTSSTASSRKAPRKPVVSDDEGGEDDEGDDDSMASGEDDEGKDEEQDERDEDPPSKRNKTVTPSVSRSGRVTKAPVRLTV